MNQREKFSFFRSEAERIFAWLEDHGFARCENFDRNVSTYISLVYCGRNLGLDFYYEVRDDYVGVAIIGCNEGNTLDRQGDVPRAIGDLIAILTLEMRVSGKLPEVSSGSSEGLGWITRRLEQYSQYIKTTGSAILEDNSDILDDSTETQRAQKRQQLDDAWNSGDYANIVRVYEHYRETLGKVDAKRLSYAKGKIVAGRN